MIRWLIHFLRAAYRFVFPPACPLCGAEMGSLTLRYNNRRVTPNLCPTCAEAVSPKADNPCHRCGVPLGPYVLSEDGCLYCRPRDFRFERLIRFGLYEDRLRDTVIFGKSAHAQPLSAALANQFWMTQREQLVGYVVGLPVHLDGNSSRISVLAEEFGKWLALTTKVTVVWFDERFTSHAASELIAGAKLTSKRRKALLDKLAAQVLLSAFLDSPRDHPTAIKSIED